MSLAYKLVLLFILCQTVKNTMGLGNAILKPVISEECRKRGICMEIDNYPVELAKRLIQKLKDDGDIFSDIESSQIPSTLFTNDYGEINFRFSEYDYYETPKEIPICSSKIEVYHPTHAQNANKTWKWVLNDINNPIHTVYIDLCTSEKSECSKNIDFYPNYKGKCVQRWILKKMYCIDENEKAVSDYFKIPICCSCKISHIN